MGHVNDLVKKFRGKRDDSFDDRIRALHDFYNNNEKALVHITNEANDFHLGTDSVRGAYHAALAQLKPDVNPDGKVDEDELYKVMEAYVDQALENILGAETYKEDLKKQKDLGLNEKELRKFKGNLFGIYHKDEEGRSFNPLHKELISKLENKSKAEIKAQLLQDANNYARSFTAYRHNEAVGDLIRDTDHADLAAYAHKRFEDAGIEHDKKPATKEYQQLYGDVVTHIRNGDMQKRGFRVLYDENKD